MTYHFLPPARTEFNKAALYFEAREPGLGWRFRDEVAQVIRQILENPCLWREREGGYRRVNCPVFPYYLAFIIRGDRIVIVAVAHGHRRPNYRKRRIG